MYDQGLGKMTGPERLAVEIIRQAARDYKAGPYQQEAEIFFAGQWFVTICDLLDIKPELIRQKLRRIN
jgi:hypothetical protein